MSGKDGEPNVVFHQLKGNRLACVLGSSQAFPQQMTELESHRNLQCVPPELESWKFHHSFLCYMLVT